MSIRDSLEKVRSIFRKNYDTIYVNDISDELCDDIPILKDAKGRLCPLNTIHAVDLARHDLVTDRLTAAKALRAQLQAFKEQTFDDIEAFIELSAAEYDVKMGGAKGNLALVNHDETLKLRIAISDRITFDERLQVAKQLFDELIAEHSAGLDEVIAVLIQEVFKVDKAGKVDARKVLDLRKYKVKHPKWEKAMQAINDSIKIMGSKSYIQMYERPTPNDDWGLVSLDLAKL
jgi:hypothetical protein